MAERNHWHPAFVGATEWELRDNKNDLIFESEHQLNMEPLKVDMLVIKKEPSAVVENEIGKIFKRHNLVEFKGYGDGFSIDDYYKVMGYACIYKSLGEHVNDIPAEDVTITVMRAAYPRELEKYLRTKGLKFQERYPGIYYLIGNPLFEMQYIVTTGLDKEKHATLRILREQAEKEDVKRFLFEAGLAKEPGDLHNIDSILQVSVSANINLYEEIRKEDAMCQALRDLMKDEIDKEVAERVRQEGEHVVLNNIQKLMKTMNLTAEEAMQALELSEEEQA